MAQNLKKFFLNFLTLKKVTGWIFLFSVILGTVIPIYYIYAMNWDMVFQSICPGWLGIKGIISILSGEGPQFFNSIIASFFSVLILITSPFLVLSHALLNWVTSPGFVNISFTGADNPIVQEGWQIVRNFTNMFIVLGFVIIALATILRRQEYQAQKLLPLLIGIALLINFTPVICGFFIDISNVAMNYFLTAGTLDRSFLETLDYQISSMPTDDTGKALGMGIVFSGFNIIGGIIFLLFALLFAVRYVALWILIILSPLAFFCYILPATKGIWSIWWKQFFQWCIIGIPAAFFIYLSNITIATIVDTSTPTGALSGFASLFSYTIPLLFLIVGLFASLQTGAIGADKLISFAQTGGTKAGRWAGRKVKETPYMKDQAAKWRGRVEKIPEKIPGRIGREAEIKNREAREKRIEEKAKHFGLTDPETSEYLAKSDEDKAAKVLAHARQDKISGQDKKDITYLKQRGAFEQVKEVIDKRPDLAVAANPEKVNEMMKKRPGISRAEAESQIIQEKVQGTTPLKFRQNTQAGALENGDVLSAVIEDERKFEEIKRRGSMEQRKAIHEGLHKNIDKIDANIAKLMEEHERGIKGSEEKAKNLRKRVVEIESSPDFI